MPGNQITFGVGFNVNESNLNKLKQSLKEIQQLTAQDLVRNGQFNNLQQAEQQLKHIKQSAAEVQDALSRAFNANLGTTNITKLNTELKKIDLNTIARNFGQAGAAGQAAFNQLSTSIFKVNTQLKQSSSFISNIRTTLANTIKWNIASSAINTFTGSIQSAFNYVKALDASLTDIRIVTGQSREEMAQFAQQANDAAQALGRQTKDYTNAALSFYQQGLNETEVQTRTEATLKAQNVTGAGQEMADYLTAVWNGYKVVNDEIELYVDKLAAVADSSASNLSELATGMSKVASTANAMGVDMDQLTAQLATIIATTRQAPETVGNALKTIYARINDIKSGTDEAEISLGNYTSKMASLGFNVLDADGKLKDTGVTMEEIGERWNTMTREQQIYLAQTMAGQRQMNNLIALFDNWEKYSEMLNVSLNAQGSLNEKNERYMDSLAAHMNQFKASVEGLQDALISEDDLKSLYDIGSNIIHLTTQFTEGIGGMRGAVAGFGAIATRIFGAQLTDSIVTALNNARLLNNELNAQASRSQFSQKWSNIANDLTQSEAIRSQAQAYVELDAAIQRVYSSLSQEQKEAINVTMDQIAATDDLKAHLLETGKQAANMAEAYRQFRGGKGNQQQTLFTQTDKGELSFNNDKLKEQQILLDQLINKLNQYRKSLISFQNNTSNLEEVRSKFEQISLTSDSTGDAFLRLVEDTETLANSTDKDEQQFRELVLVLLELHDAAKAGLLQDGQGVLEILDMFAQGANETTEHLIPLIEELNSTSTAVKAVKQEMLNGQQATHSYNNQLATTTEATKQLHQVLNDKAFAQGITQMTQGLSSFLFGLQSLSTIKQTFKDIEEGTVNTGDAILRISTSMLMGLSMLTTGFKTLRTGTLAAASALATFPQFATAAAAAGYTAEAGFTSAGVAAKFLGTALIDLIKPFLPLGLAIGAVIAVIYGLYAAATKEERALKKMQEQAEESANKYKELKSSYDELKQSLEDYQAARDALSELTKGTEEWSEAVDGLNEKVLALLEKYPELAQYVQRLSDGSLIIDEKGLSDFQQKQLQAIQDANIQRYSDNIATNRQQIKTDAATINRHYTADNPYATIGMTPDWIIDFAEEFNRLPEELRGQIDQIIAESGDNAMLLHADIQQFVEENWDSLKNTALTQSQVTALLSAQNEEFFALAKNMQDINLTNQQYAEEIGHIVNQSTNNSDYLNSAYQNYIDSWIGSILYAADYSKQTIEDVKNNLSQYVHAIEDTFSPYENEDKLLEKLFGFTGGRTVDLNDLTLSERDNLYKMADSLTKNAQEILDVMGISFENIKKAVGAAQTNFNTKLSQLSQEVPMLHDAVFGDFNNPKIGWLAEGVSNKVLYNQLEPLFDTMKDVYAKGGKEAADAFGNLLTQVKTPEQLQQFLDLINNINLDTPISSFEELGFSFDSLTDDAHTLITALGEIDLTEAFMTNATNYKEAKDIAEGLHYGDAISSEDRDKLQAYGIDTDQFFKVNRRGEYELIESAEALNDAIDKIDTDSLLTGIEAINEKIRELQGLAETDLFGEDLQKTKFGENDFRLSDDDRDLAIRRANYIADQGGTSNLSALDARSLADKLQSEGTGIISDKELENLNKAMNMLPPISDEIERLNQSKQTYQDALASGHIFDEDAGSIEDIEKRAEFLKEYGKELYGISQDLEDNHEAAMLIAEDFLRAEAAVKDVEKNLDKWKKAFADPLDDIGAFIESMEELENDYKDFLNLDQKAHLSDSFLESADNLALMEQAIQGGVEGMEAYEQLAEAAQQDLLNQGQDMIIKLNPELSEEGLAELESNLMQHVNDIENSIADIEVGADLNDEGFIAELDNLINAAGLTADQATALLASMGIDATVVEGDPSTAPSTQSAQAYTGPEYTTQEVEFGGPFGGGKFTYPKLVSPGTWEPITSTNEDSSPRPFSLHVENATKGVGSGGNINTAKAKGSGGSGGGGKKGGGGGGGNKAPKKKDPIKKFKAKIDPYHDVNIKIGDTQEALDKLGKQRNKLIGKDAVDNLTKQIDLMEREKDLLKEKNAIAQSELDRQAKELANLGAIFEKNGDIANYKQLLLDKQNQVNNAIAVANGLVGDERDAYEKYVNQLKDEYKELEDAIKEYDETMQLMDDLSADYQDLIDKQIELAIEAFDLEINVKLDLKDAEKDFNDFRKKVIDEVKDDQYGGLAEAAARNYSSYYNMDNRGNVGGIIPDLRQHAQDVQREIQIMTNGGWSQIYGDNLAAAADDLKKYNDELMDALEEAQDVIDETHDHFLDAIDAMDEAFDTQQDNLDKIDDLLTHDMEILQLIHGEENFDEMDRLWQQQINQDTTRLEALQAEQKYWQDRLKDYEEGTDEWKKAMENWQDAFEKTNEAMMTSVENLQSKWENSINSIMSSLRNATYGGNMDAALEDWDKLTWHSDRYLDSLERANGLLDLQHNYIDAINATNDPKLQQKLADLEEKQLEALSNKEHIREIDLQIAQQQLTVLQAQIALEDAQQAKTKLRLRRDSQGNYTYQYVADEDDIAEKTQEYAKALADYREMVKNSLHEDLQDLSDYTQEFYDKMQEAQMKYGDDTKALMAEQERLYELYMGEDGYITRLAKDAQSSMQDYQTATFTQAMGLNNLLEEDLFNKFLGPDSEMRVAINDLLGAGGEIPSLIDSFINDSALVAFDTISEATKKTLSGPEGLLPEWQSALWTIADTYDTDFVPRVINAMNYLQQANQSYVNGLAIMQQAANRTTEQIALGLAYDTAYTNALDEATKTLLTTQDAQLSKAEKVYESLKKNEQAFKDQSEAAIDAANAMFLYWLSLNGQTASGLPYSLEGVTPNIRITTPTIVSNQPSYTGSSYGDYDGGGGGGGNSGNTGGGSKPAPTTPRTTSSYGGNRDSSAYWAAAYDRSRLATGGYTGEWNDEPRLAWLDQKELVLNSDDTKNILDSVNIVRTIADRVTAMTGAAAASMSATSAAGLMSTIGQTILQDVIINADFPAVQDAAQIKQAFNELVNLASQRASTNRRA